MNARYGGLKITTAVPEAGAAIAAFADALLSHGNDTGVIFAALDADPDCALAQALAGALFLTAMTREGQIQAAPRIRAAEVLSRFASGREQHFIEAVSAWGKGDERRAIQILRGIVENWPHDLVAAKFCQILELNAGDFAGMVRTSAMTAAVEERAGHGLGLHAFALEQNNAPELAYRFARRAIELSPGRDPWAQHAAAHALAAMGQPVEARAFLHAHAAEWTRCSSFMLTHNWWHLALFTLQLGDPAAGLELFDNRVWGVRKGHCQDQINAISLLALLDMAGIDTGSRWEDIAGHVEGRAGDRVSAFLDLHYLYALARAGRDSAAEILIAGLCEAGRGPVVRGLAHGMAAHARGHYADAAHCLGPVQAALPVIGGSNVQRSFFSRVFADSLRKARAGLGVPPRPAAYLKAA